MDAVRILDPIGREIGIAEPPDGCLPGAASIVGLHWSASETLVVVRKRGDVHLYNMRGIPAGHFTVAPNEGSRVVLQSAMAGHCLVAITLGTLLPGDFGSAAHEQSDATQQQSDDSGAPHLVVVPDIRRPGINSTVVLSDGGEAKRALAVLSAAHSGTGHPEVILAHARRPTLMLATYPHYQPQDMHTQDAMPDSILDMAVSPSGNLLACFDAVGTLSVVSTDFTRKVLHFATQEQTSQLGAPDQLAWCGGSPEPGATDASAALDFAVAMAWHGEGVVLVHASEGKDARVEIIGDVHIVQEVDGLRIMGDMEHMFVEQVAPSLVETVSSTSMELGVVLMQAADAFHNANARCDDDIRYLQQRGELHTAVLHCIDAALKQWDVDSQKQLLRAASYGKRFDSEFSAAPFMTAAKTLRTVNQLRSQKVAMPLTVRQFDLLSPEVVIGRLLSRKQHALALGIAEYWPLPGVVSRIVEHWACAKIHAEAGKRPHADIRDDIRRRLSDMSASACPYAPAAYSGAAGGSNRPQGSEGMSVSYADMAAAAQAAGQRSLATMLLQLEPRAAEQVPLLLRMGAGQQALQRALHSRDMDLVYMCLLHLRSTMSAQASIDVGEGRVLPGEEAFLEMVVAHPVAAQLLLRYASHQDPDLAARLHNVRSDFMESARAILLLACDDHGGASSQVDEEDSDELLRQALLRREAGVIPGQAKARSIDERGLNTAAAVLRRGVEGGKKELGFFAEATSRAVRLREVQHTLLDKHGINAVGDSLLDTVAAAVGAKDDKLVNKLRSDFKMGDALFAGAKLRTLAALGRWEELIKWGTSKRNHGLPWDSFVKTCMKYHAPEAAAVFVPKLPDAEEQYDAYMSIGRFSDAVQVALKLKDPARVAAVGEATQAPAVKGAVEAALRQLR